MNKVFVIQATRNQADVGPAAAYGEIVFVLDFHERSSRNPDVVRQRLERGLQGFNSETDFVVWAGGDPLSFFLVGSIFQARGMTSFRYLRYERMDPRRDISKPFYVPVTVTLE